MKFIIGKYNSFAEANAKKREIAALFPDAFIVALQDGIRISLEEARAWRK